MEEFKIQFTDIQARWINHLASKYNISKSNVVRNYMSFGFDALTDEEMEIEMGRDDGLGRTRAESSKYADADGNVDSTRIPDQLYKLLKEDVVLYLRTLNKDVYTIKRIKVLSFSLYNIKYVVDSKNASKVHEIRGDAAAERFVDEFGMPYVDVYYRALVSDINRGNLKKYVDCVWKNADDFKDVPVSDMSTAGNLRNIVSSADNIAKNQLFLRYAYSVCKVSARYVRALRSRTARTENKFVIVVDKAERIILNLNKRSVNKNVSKPINNNNNKNFDVADWMLDLPNKLINKKKKKD